MKKILCLFITVLLLLTCVGCSAEIKDTETTKSIADSSSCGSSFIVVEKDFINGYWYRIAYHKDTKVMYVLGHYCDFTVMLNPDGSPMIWEGK
jgi:hypothetical protein